MRAPDAAASSFQALADTLKSAVIQAVTEGFDMIYHDGYLDSDELPRSSRLAAGVVDVVAVSGD